MEPAGGGPEMSGGTQPGSGAPKAGDSGPTASSGSNKLTISLSAIVASLWAGIWGFDWAASHLDSGALLFAILVSLVFGAVITYYISSKTFEILDRFERWQHEAQMRQLGIEAYRAVNHLPPGQPLPHSEGEAKIMVDHAVELLRGAAMESPPTQDRK